MSTIPEDIQYLLDSLVKEHRRMSEYLLALETASCHLEQERQMVYTRILKIQNEIKSIIAGF